MVVHQGCFDIFEVYWKTLRHLVLPSSPDMPFMPASIMIFHPTSHLTYPSYPLYSQFSANSKKYKLFTENLHSRGGLYVQGDGSYMTMRQSCDGALRGSHPSDVCLQLSNFSAICAIIGTIMI